MVFTEVTGWLEADEFLDFFFRKVAVAIGLLEKSGKTFLRF